MKHSGRLIYDASESCADLLYISGFSAPDPFLWISIDGQEYVIVNSMELERARKQSRQGVEVLSDMQAAEKWGLGKAKFSIPSLIAAIGRATDTWNWEVPNSFPLILADKIANSKLKLANGRGFAGEKFSFFGPDGMFFPQRAIKSPQEVEALRQAEKIAEAGLSKAVLILQEASIQNDGILAWNGTVLTAEILQGEINAEIARHGGSASHTITAPGRQAADPHQEGTGPVHANEPIVFDIFPRCDRTGYFGDLSRTLLKGKAPEIVKKAFSAVYDAQRAVIDMLKPGITGREAQDMAAVTMEKQGFKTDLKADIPYGFIHSVGHGLGLEIHEEPRLSRGNMSPLKAGNVVTDEPGLYYPEWGGIRIEDVLHITEDGVEDLTSAPVFLEIQ